MSSAAAGLTDGSSLQMCIRDSYKIKLLGRAMRTGPNSVSAFVAPHLVSKSNPLANVDGVINGISVKGDAVGEAMFFGPGAGAHPTASAVAGDIIDLSLIHI